MQGLKRSFRVKYFREGICFCNLYRGVYKLVLLLVSKFKVLFKQLKIAVLDDFLAGEGKGVNS